MKESRASLKSRSLISLTFYLTLFDRKRTPSIARIPSVRSSPQPISLVLISRGPVGSSSLDSSLEPSHVAYSKGQYVAGSGREVYWMGCSVSWFCVNASLGLFSNFLERIERAFSTIFISALHSLMVSSAGSDILCKLSAMLVSYEIFVPTLNISPYR